MMLWPLALFGVVLAGVAYGRHLYQPRRGEVFTLPDIDQLEHRTNGGGPYD